MRSADSNVSLYSDSQGHVDGGTEGDGGHGVEEVDVQLGEERGHGEPTVDYGQGGVGVDWHIGYYVSKVNKGDQKGK